VKTGLQNNTSGNSAQKYGTINELARKEFAAKFGLIN
jgi:hypothetical protein